MLATDSSVGFLLITDVIGLHPEIRNEFYVRSIMLSELFVYFFLFLR
jgi:hypothetical protein